MFHLRSQVLSLVCFTLFELEASLRQVHQIPLNTTASKAPVLEASSLKFPPFCPTTIRSKVTGRCGTIAPNYSK